MTAPPAAHVVRFLGPRRVDLAPANPLRPSDDQVLLRTLYSGVSTGTELTTYLGSNPHLHRSWDPEQRLFVAGRQEPDYPVVGAGYEEVGEVVAVPPGRDHEVAVGDIVWGIWGHRSDGVLAVADAAAQRLPAGTDPVVGVFARVGAVALNAVIEADIHVGETVAVFGQGVIGQLAVRLAALNGATVIAVDTEPDRLRRSAEFGATHTLDPTEHGVAEAVRELTGGRGADACIELSGSHPGLQEAIRTCCYSGRVIASGFYQGAADSLRLGEEFHHNRIELVSSQISGPPPRYAHRWPRTRLHRGFMELVVSGRLDPRPLVSHVLPARQVADAFHTITSGGSSAMQVVLDFGQDRS